jgi:hypothetical protein
MVEHKATPFRETAGILVAATVVLAYVGMGFVQALVLVVYGATFTFDADYKTALLGLSSMALGFLVGSQSDGKTTRTPVGFFHSPK